MKAVLAVLFVFVFVVACNGQPKSNYRITANPVSGATKYYFFVEKKSANPYKLVQDMNYKTLGADTLTLKVGTANTPSFKVLNITNDGSEYRLGVVAFNSEGIFSGMGTGIDLVGTVPGTPGGISWVQEE